MTEPAEPIQLDFDAGPMSLIESNGNKTWIVWARSKGVLHRLNIKVGRDQAEMIGRSERYVLITDAPCA
jgi:hypothetical protein